MNTHFDKLIAFFKYFRDNKSRHQAIQEQYHWDLSDLIMMAKPFVQHDYSPHAFLFVYWNILANFILPVFGVAALLFLKYTFLQYMFSNHWIESRALGNCCIRISANYVLKSLKSELNKLTKSQSPQSARKKGALSSVNGMKNITMACIEMWICVCVCVCVCVFRLLY